MKIFLFTPPPPPFQKTNKTENHIFKIGNNLSYTLPQVSASTIFRLHISIIINLDFPLIMYFNCNSLTGICILVKNASKSQGSSNNLGQNIIGIISKSCSNQF